MPTPDYTLGHYLYMTLSQMLTNIDTILGMTATSYTQAQRIEDINAGYDFVVAKTQNVVDGTYWDDINHAGISTHYINIVSGVREYKIVDDSENARITEIHSIGIKKNTDYKKLDRKDLRDEVFISENSTGTPSYYAHNGNYIIFDITPNFSETNGVKIIHSRVSKRFTSEDTDMEPGFYPIYHSLLPKYCAMTYAGRKNLDTYTYHETQFFLLLNELIVAMGQVHDDRNTQVTAYNTNFI